nr:hypothetical protein [Solobacterium sp.]
MKNPEAYTNKYNELAAGILMDIYQEDKTANVVCSPLSVLILLALAADSTAGKTRKEILDAIDGKLSEEDFAELIRGLQETLKESGTLKSANAVCTDHSIEDTINRDFIPLLQKQYGGELFASDNLAEDVNEWVKQKTDGMIYPAMGNPPDDFKLALMNAVAFTADWEEEYEDEDIYDERFTCADRTVKTADMLHGTEHEYIETKYLKGFVKPYKGGEYSFMALLPKKGNTLAAVMKRCDFTGLFNSRIHEDVYTVMPGFKYDTSRELTGYCMAAGIRTLFSDRADFSPLSSAWLKA